MDDSLDYAKNRGHDLLARAEADLSAGRITESEWYTQIAAVITPAYLHGGNPRAQSGHSGDERRWRQARGLLLEALDQDGSFLDVGCANGHLMETLRRWAAEESDIDLEMHGLDIAPELADLARARLPRWARRIHVGNALTWHPPRRYDYVRTGLEYVPRGRQPDLLRHLLDNVVTPSGRLLVGVYNEERDDLLTGASVAETVRAWGFPVAGQAEREHARDARLRYRVLWIQ